MKIICTQENLKAGLLIASKVVGQTNTLPILNTVLLKTENGQLNILSTNLEIGLQTEIRCKIEKEGSVCLPARVFLELIQSLPSGNIELESQDNIVTLKSDNYNTKINSFPTDEFPILPQLETQNAIKIEAQELKKALDHVVFSASTNETQPEISGVLARLKENEITFVATDRYRLAEKKLSITNTQQKDIILPQRTAIEISRLAGNINGPVDLVFNETQCGVFFENTKLISRVVDGQYPEYEQIIPKDPNTTIVVETASLLGALKTTGIFSQGTQSIQFKYDTETQELLVSSSSNTVGESEVRVSADIHGPSDIVLLNYRYVLDALQVMSEPSVVIEVVNDTAAVIFKPHSKTDYMYLVMPIKN